MKRFIVSSAIVIAVMAGACAATLPEGVTASTNIPEAVYPCVDGSSRATFRVHAPEANDVKVDICGKKYDMTRDADGYWMVTTDPLVVGFHYYFIVVDGVSVIDPRRRRFSVAAEWQAESRFLRVPRRRLIIPSTRIFLTVRCASASITPT